MSRSLSQFATDLRRLPRVVAQKATARTADVLTALAKKTFGASETPYHIKWAPGADGKTVTLRKSGGIANGLYYVAIGTKLRVKLGVAWAKFQIGRRQVFPTQGAPLPPDYSQAISRAVVDVCREELQQ